MLPAFVDTALLIANSAALFPRGHPEALRDMQRCMRLINATYAHPSVLRLTDDVVRAMTMLHGPPDGESEDLHRLRALRALDRLRQILPNMPDPSPQPVRSQVR